MNESRAVAAYLASKYGKEGASLYPGDVETRVRVDQRLYFDMGTFYKVRSHLLLTTVSFKKCWSSVIIVQIEVHRSRGKAPFGPRKV